MFHFTMIFIIQHKNLYIMPITIILIYLYEYQPSKRILPDKNIQRGIILLI